MNKLRLFLFDKCERNCIGCCNKQWNIDSLELENDFTNYELIMLTGGEPMLNPLLVIETIHKIKEQNSLASIIMYAAKTDKPDELLLILDLLNGLTLTLHEKDDIMPFLVFNRKMEIENEPNTLLNKSLRLNIFKDVEYPTDLYSFKYISKFWRIKKDIEWLSPCPLPDGETFKKIDKRLLKW